MLHKIRASKWSRIRVPRVRVQIFGFVFIGICVGVNVILIARYFDSGSTYDQSALAGPSAISRQAGVVSPNHANSPVVIAHVVSLIKCSKQERVTGFLDAAAVLRHSIHKNSVHVHTGKSKYSYQMYAIVHESCQDHAHALDRLGYRALVKPSPIKVEDIAEGYLKGHIEMENCCGSAEFIK